MEGNKNTSRAVVAAQLVERSLLTPEIRSSNPNIDEILPTNCTIEKTKIKKEAGNVPFKKRKNNTSIYLIG